jgi:hypothetical protein
MCKSFKLFAPKNINYRFGRNCLEIVKPAQFFFQIEGLSTPPGLIFELASERLDILEQDFSWT